MSKHQSSATQASATQARASRSNPPKSKVQSALLLHNPKAGNADQLELCLDALRHHGIEVETNTNEDWAAHVKDSANYDAIIVAGGDGSINFHLSSLRHIDLPIGIMPMGTANDFANSVSISADLMEAAKCIADGHVKTIDLGKVNDVYFINAAHCGAGEMVSREITALEKRLLGKGAYLASLVRVLRTIKPFSMTFTGRKTRRRKIIALTVCNGRHFGGGLNVTENALTDGKLTYFYVRPMRLTEATVLAWKLLLRKFGADVTAKDLPRLHVHDTQKVHIDTDHAMEISVDGDVKTSTPATFSIAPEKIDIIVPDPKGDNMIINDDHVALNQVIKQSLFTTDMYSNLREAISAQDAWHDAIDQRHTELDTLMQLMREDDCLPAMPSLDREAVDQALLSLKGLFIEDEQVYARYFSEQESIIEELVKNALEQNPASAMRESLLTIQSATSGLKSHWLELISV